MQQAEAEEPSGGRGEAAAGAPVERILLHPLCGPAIVALTCLLVFFVNLGQRPLFDPDESRAAEVAREILVTGNWLTPTLGFQPYHDKPIFFYWLVALCLRAFGLTEWAARLPSATAACLSVAFTVWWGSRYLGRLQGVLSGLMLATTALYVGLGRYVLIDMMFSFWVAAAFFYGAAWCLDGRDRRRPLWPFYVLIGLATMTKGPVALVLAVLTFTPFAYRAGLLPQFREFRFGQGLAIMFGVAGCWYLAVGISAPEYLTEFLWRHNVGHFLSAQGGHGTNPFAYGYLLPAAFLPWSLYWPVVGTQLANGQRRSAAWEFCLLWIGVTFIFFSLSAAKNATYLLPAFPPLALLTADALVDVVSGKRLPPRGELMHRLVFTGIALALLAAPLAAYVVFRFFAPDHVMKALLPLIAMPALVPGVRWLRKRRYDLMLAAVFLFALTAIVSFDVVIGPALSDLFSLKRPAQLLSLLPDHTRVVCLRTRRQALLFYTQRPIEVARTAEQAATWLSESEPVALFTRTDRVERLRCHLQGTMYNWRQGQMRRALIVNRPPPAGAGVVTDPLTPLPPSVCEPG